MARTFVGAGFVNRPRVLNRSRAVNAQILVGRVGRRLLNPVMLRSAPPPILMTWMAETRQAAFGYDHLHER